MGGTSRRPAPQGRSIPAQACGIATVSEVATVGFSSGKEPTVNPRTVDRGYELWDFALLRPRTFVKRRVAPRASRPITPVTDRRYRKPRRPEASRYDTIAHNEEADHRGSHCHAMHG